ncbi:MAG TPA: hypothetical protein VIM58_02480, partial [Candidatus Methylacidiphilales bacterium]
DWEKGEATLSRVYYRPGPETMPLAFRDGPPEFPIRFHGRRYLTDAYNSNATNGHESAFLFLDKPEGAVPVAGIGRAQGWEILGKEPFLARWPEGITPKSPYFQKPAFFVWCDLNGDGQPQPEEVTIVPGRSGGVTMGDDGSFLLSYFSPAADGSNAHALRFPPSRFTDRDVPVYDVRGREIAPAQPPAGDGGDQLLLNGSGSDGWAVQTTAPPPFSKLGLGGSKNGVPQWSYPSLWPGLHPSHNAPTPDAPGILIGTTRLLGGLLPMPGSETGPLFSINSNQGFCYLFTEDGLFVSALFHDMRQGTPWQMPSVQRNMLLNDLSLHDENFFPSISQTPDGKVYLGSGNPALVRLDGLESLRRIAPIPVSVTAADLQKAQDYVAQREADLHAAQGSGVLPVPLLAEAPSLDGSSEAWTGTGLSWLPVDQRGYSGWFNSNSTPYDVSATVVVAKDKLFAAWKTGDPALLQNSGAVPNAPFKTGGALDLMLGTRAEADPARPAPVEGDERLLVTRVGGKTKALLYRAVVPGTPPDQKVPFRAPWHEITLDRVDDVSGQVQFAEDGKGGYQIAVPLAVLGLSPQPGMRIKGDIGVLRGTGTATTQRVYWSNKATAIVSDVPTEAALTPNLWGVFEFRQP